MKRVARDQLRVARREAEALGWHASYRPSTQSGHPRILLERGDERRFVVVSASPRGQRSLRHVVKDVRRALAGTRTCA